MLDADGGANHPAYSPDGRWLAAVGILHPHPLDDVMPGLLLGPADGSRPPVALAPELDRPIGNWTDTDLTGWMVSGRYGPVWRDERTIVAVVTDRGRALPEQWQIDPRSRRAARRSVRQRASERRTMGGHGDARDRRLRRPTGSWRWRRTEAAGWS